MFASSSLEEVYHYVYYQLTSVALTMLDDVNGLSINFFSNEFIQAIVNFFTLFAWGLGLTGAAIAIMDFAVSYQTGGGGSFAGTGATGYANDGDFLIFVFHIACFFLLIVLI